jgi:hypothetical protein
MLRTAVKFNALKVETAHHVVAAREHQVEIWTELAHHKPSLSRLDEVGNALQVGWRRTGRDRGVGLSPPGSLTPPPSPLVTLAPPPPQAHARTFAQAGWVHVDVALPPTPQARRTRRTPLTHTSSSPPHTHTFTSPLPPPPRPRKLLKRLQA